MALLDASLTQALELTSKGMERNYVGGSKANASMTEAVERDVRRRPILADFSDGKSVSMTSDNTCGQTHLQNAASTLMRESADYKTSKVPMVPR